MTSAAKITAAALIAVLAFALTFSAAIIGGRAERQSAEVALLQARKEDLIAHERDTLLLMQQLNTTVAALQARLDGMEPALKANTTAIALGGGYNISIPPLPQAPAVTPPPVINNPPPARAS